MASDQLTLLRTPFPEQDVQLKPAVLSKDSRRALALAYIEARAVMDRLDEAVEPSNWRDSYRVLADRRGDGGQVEVECRLSIHLGDEWITKVDAGIGDDLKAAYSDALKRAGVKWGIGRYLYSLPSVWADYDPTRREVKDPAVVRRQILGSNNAEGTEGQDLSAAEEVKNLVIQTKFGPKRLGDLAPSMLERVATAYPDQEVREKAAQLLARQDSHA